MAGDDHNAKYLAWKNRFFPLVDVVKEAGLLSSTLRPIQSFSKTKIWREDTPENVDELLRRLIEKKLLASVTQGKKPQLSLSDNVPKPFVLQVVGLPQAGKTTVCAQIARYCESVLGLTAGLISVGRSYGQLRDLAPNLRIYGRSGSQRDILKVVEEGLTRFRHKDVIILDSVSSFKNAFDRKLKHALSPMGTFVVFDGRHEGLVRRQASKFKALSPTAIVGSFVNGPCKGGLYNLAHAMQCPVNYVSTGPLVSDFQTDIQAFLVEKMFGPYYFGCLLGSNGIILLAKLFGD